MVTVSKQIKVFLQKSRKKGRGLSASKKSFGFRIADSDDLRFPSS
jgi:hypothetical protein